MIDFSSTTTARPSAGALSPPIGSAGDASFSIDIPAGGVASSSASSSGASFFSVQYYSQYFNVDTADVSDLRLRRIRL